MAFIAPHGTDGDPRGKATHLLSAQPEQVCPQQIHIFDFMTDFVEKLDKDQLRLFSAAQRQKNDGTVLYLCRDILNAIELPGGWFSFERAGQGNRDLERKERRLL